jgi:hypothetical protein
MELKEERLGLSITIYNSEERLLTLDYQDSVVDDRSSLL